MTYAHWPSEIAIAFAAYDAARHLEPADPCRMAAADCLWCAQHPDWQCAPLDEWTPF